MRVGTGYDVHRLVAGRPLVLGGVTIPHELGLDGHSDADALLHAVMDALLGAAGMEDIGHLFPPEDQRFKNASSLGLLAEVAKRIGQAGWKVANVDSTVIAERPKLAPHLGSMKEAISGILRLETSRIGIKATTNEGLGFAGRREGIAAMAVALLVRREVQDLEE
jgi:2-C-methyl-D-erythritol 2,4-cyclodiphosphate synthase